MSILLYSAVMIAAIVWVTRNLLPELLKPPLPNNPAKSNTNDYSQPGSIDKRIEKLEILLAEKNKNINVLQTELTVFLVQVREFDKIKNLMEDEIHRLREQNRIFRSELGLPAGQQSREKSTV